MSDSGIPVEAVEEIARATQDKVEKETAKMRTRTGTVVTSTASSEGAGFPILTVKMDGDDPDNTSPVVSIIGDRQAGDRVTVMTVPPRGALAIGGDRSIPSARLGESGGGSKE